MTLDATHPTPDNVKERVLRDLGALAPVFSARDLLITGGYLVRVALEMPIGADIDVVCDVDSFSALRTELFLLGYVRADTVPSTAFREGAESGVWFREKYDAPHPDDLENGVRGPSIDCLILRTSSHFDDADGIVEAAKKFLETYDYHVGRQLLELDAGEFAWFMTPESEEAMRKRVPGWTEFGFTQDDRRYKWNALLPGKP